MKSKALINETSGKMLLLLKAGGISDKIARYLVAQSRFETGDFTSPLCRLYNNYFGMKWASWQNVASQMQWAYPSDLADSIRVQIGWLKRTNFPKDVSNLKEFVSELKARKYFGNESSEVYYNGLNSKLDSHE